VAHAARVGFYRAECPEKLANLPKIMEKFDGKWEEITPALAKKVLSCEPCLEPICLAFAFTSPSAFAAVLLDHGHV
jgi:hypothetical protein